MKLRTMRWLIASTLCLVGLQAACAQTPPAAEADYSSELPRIAPLTTEEEQKTFQLQPGFRIELVAAEPLVKSPVAYAFNGQGELFVVEMCDYSEQETEHLGSIAKLIDVDRDGKMDKRTTYAEGLSWPTAIWTWKDGVIVAEPPNLLWLRDTDGDGVSDKRELWYEGFGRSNVQGLVNSLRWTNEGYIAGATSSSGADLKPGTGANDSSRTITLRGRDFVLDPLNQSLSPASGGGQHGMFFNRWGDKFATSNSDHLQQIINLDPWLSQQSVSVPIPSLRRSIAEDGPQAEVYRSSPVEPWRIVRTRLRVSGAVPGVVEGGGRAAGYFTGATGTCIMDREVGFGDGEYDTALVCDVGSNLVHRKRLLPKGLFYSGQRIDKESELLRASDIWFRPVQLGDGPDGALYVVDMYREVIEHPKSLPPVIKRHLDLTSGRDRGRIWRVVPTDSKVVTDAKATVQPGKLSATDLVALLDHSVAWQRRMASQLLIERQDRSAVGALEKQVQSGQRPEGRLLAMHVLNRLGALSVDTLRTAVKDSHPRVAASAIELAGNLKKSSELQDELTKVQADDSHVQLAIATVSATLPADTKLNLLSSVLSTTKEPLVRAAVLVAAGGDSPQLFSSTSKTKVTDELLKMALPAWTQALRDKSATATAFRKSVAAVLAQELAEKSTSRTQWTNAFVQLPGRATVDTLLDTLDESTRKQYMTFISESATSAVKKLEDQPDASSELAKAKWMRLMPSDQLNSLTADLLSPTYPEALQLAVAESLLWNDIDAGIGRVLPALSKMTPGLKRQVLGMVLGYAQALPRVADAIERKEISKAEIAPDVRQQLFAVPNKQQAERFKKLLTAASSDRAGIIEKYRPQLAQVAQANSEQIGAGRETFKKVCAQCHRLQDMGNDVGPPLKQLADKSPDQLLDIILDPNREVDPKYLGYSVLLTDGRVLSGIIREESAGQIVLAETGGKLHTIARSDIDQLKTTGLSLMPNGLEEQISPEAMSQLIAYLKQAGQSK